jgi:hypothetical protein
MAHLGRLNTLIPALLNADTAQGPPQYWGRSLGLSRFEALLRARCMVGCDKNRCGALKRMEAKQCLMQHS